MTTSPLTEPRTMKRDDFLPIADYAMLSDCNSAALVAKDGSIDWLCLPRFDSSALFARLLDPEAGHWSIAPRGAFTVERRYLPGTLVLETTFRTDSGKVKLIDALAFARGPAPARARHAPAARAAPLRRGRRGQRRASAWSWRRGPSTGWSHPLLRMTDDGARTFGGPNPVALRSERAGRGRGRDDVQRRFTVAEGERVGFALRWAPPESTIPTPTAPADVPARVEDTAEGWRSWEAEHDIYDGPHRELVQLQRARAEGADLPPHRRDRGRAYHLASRGRGRRAQLGLPLRLDPRRQPHDGGALRRRLLRTRPTSSSRS